MDVPFTWKLTGGWQFGWSAEFPLGVRCSHSATSARTWWRGAGRTARSTSCGATRAPSGPTSATAAPSSASASTARSCGTSRTVSRRRGRCPTSSSPLPQFETDPRRTARPTTRRPTTRRSTSRRLLTTGASASRRSSASRCGTTSRSGEAVPRRASRRLRPGRTHHQARSGPFRLDRPVASGGRGRGEVVALRSPAGVRLSGLEERCVNSVHSVVDITRQGSERSRGVRSSRPGWPWRRHPPGQRPSP